MASPLDTQSTGAHARLVAISGPLSGEGLPLTAGGVRIGRDSSNDICLPDLALSRTHCTIGTPDGTWRVCDSQSPNGTFVNGVPVTDHQLNDRDRITLGGSVCLFVLNAHPPVIPPLLERPIEPATRLPVDDTIYLRQVAESPATARAAHDLPLSRAFREAHHSYTEAARLLGLHPNYRHRLIRALEMKSILEPDR